MRCIVVGAGIVGLSIAWELSRRGAAVVVLDPAPATGATRAAAGMLAAVTEFHYQERGLLPLSLDAARRWPGWAADLAKATGRDLGHRGAGTLAVAAEAGDRAALADLAAAQRAAGLDVEQLTTREARRAEPLLSPRVAGAFGAPADTAADPRRTAAALQEALRAAGAEFVTASATRVAAGAAPVVEYDGGALAGDHVVLATGLGRPELAGLGAAPVLPVRPIHGDILRLAVPAATPAPAGRTIRALVDGRGLYIVPRADGEVVLGATEREDGRDAVSAGGTHRLLRDGIRVLPALGEYDLVEALARARPGTPDNLPLLGPLGPGVSAALGFHRHGVLLSAAAAAAAADLAEGTAPATDLTAFDPWRFS